MYNVLGSNLPNFQDLREVIFLLALIQEAPTIPLLMEMVDAGTLLLLASLMILMKILAVTGFFQWFAVRLLQVQRAPANRKYRF